MQNWERAQDRKHERELDDAQVRFAMARGASEATARANIATQRRDEAKMGPFLSIEQLRRKDAKAKEREAPSKWQLAS